MPLPLCRSARTACARISSHDFPSAYDTRAHTHTSYGHPRRRRRVYFYPQHNSVLFPLYVCGVVYTLCVACFGQASVRTRVLVCVCARTLG